MSVFLTHAFIFIIQTWLFCLQFDLISMEIFLLSAVNYPFSIYNKTSVASANASHRKSLLNAIRQLYLFLRLKLYCYSKYVLEKIFMIFPEPFVQFIFIWLQNRFRANANGFYKQT